MVTHLQQGGGVSHGQRNTTDEGHLSVVPGGNRFTALTSTSISSSLHPASGSFEGAGPLLCPGNRQHIIHTAAVVRGGVVGGGVVGGVVGGGVVGGVVGGGVVGGVVGGGVVGGVVGGVWLPCWAAILRASSSSRSCSAHTAPANTALPSSKGSSLRRAVNSSKLQVCKK